MTTLRPDLQDALRTQATVLAVGRQRRRRAATGLGSSAAIAGVVVAAIAVAPSGGPNLLGPEQAVAAISKDLSGTGILEWTRETNFLPGAPASEGRSDGFAVQSTWADLTTGDQHFKSTTFRDGSAETDPIDVEQTWLAEGELWLDEASNGQAPAPKSLGRIDPSEAPSPLDEVRSTLERAAQGKATIADRETENDQPVVVVQERNGEGTTTETWITRDASPKVLRIVEETSCEDGDGCDTNGSDPTPTVVSSTYTTRQWVIREQNSQTQALVRLPR